MKITLNSKIPESQRPAIEALVKDQVRHCQVSWLPSRFPRFVMLVEPGAGHDSPRHESSIFDTDPPEIDSISAITDLLESKIKASLASQSR